MASAKIFLERLVLFITGVIKNGDLSRLSLEQIRSLCEKQFGENSLPRKNELDKIVSIMCAKHSQIMNEDANSSGGSDAYSDSDCIPLLGDYVIPIEDDQKRIPLKKRPCFDFKNESVITIPIKPDCDSLTVHSENIYKSLNSKEWKPGSGTKTREERKQTSPEKPDQGRKLVPPIKISMSVIPEQSQEQPKPKKLVTKKTTKVGAKQIFKKKTQKNETKKQSSKLVSANCSNSDEKCRKQKDLQKLITMGFPPESAEKALSRNKNSFIRAIDDLTMVSTGNLRLSVKR